MDPVAGQASDVGQHRRTAVADGPCQLDNAARVPLCQPAQGLIEMHHGTAESQDLVPFGVGQPLGVLDTELIHPADQGLVEGAGGVAGSVAVPPRALQPVSHGGEIGQQDGDLVRHQLHPQLPILPAG